MEYTDYMMWKLVVILGLAFLYGIYRGFID